MRPIDQDKIKEEIDVPKNPPWYNCYRIVECECGCFYPSATSSCPNCGATMEEGRHDVIDNEEDADGSQAD